MLSSHASLLIYPSQHKIKYRALLYVIKSCFFFYISVCLPGSVLTFNSHGIQGKSLADAQVSQLSWYSREKFSRCSGKSTLMVFKGKV